MSYPWMLVRGASANPSSLKFSALMNKQNLIENEIFKIEKSELPILSSYSDDLVLLQDPFHFEYTKQKTIQYKGPFEPDGVKLKYWCRFNHIARQMRDLSFTNNLTYPIGHPKLCAGPDDGVKGGTIVSKINWDADRLDYFHVKNPEDNYLGVSEQTTGFSMYLDFMVEGDTIQQHNGEDPNVWFHVGDSSATTGVIVRVGVNRELKFFVRDADTTYNFISANNKITPGIFHKACLKYNPTGNVLSMKIDNVAQTDSANETPDFPEGHTNHIYLGIGTNQNSGKLVGRYRDVRWYRDLLFTTDNETNIWNNGRSISPIPFGSLAVAGYSRFHDTTYGIGYDSTGYDSTGFDTA